MNHTTVVPENMKQKQQSNGGQNGLTISECPVCGQEYAKQVVVERGTPWTDLYGGSLFDYLTRYRRRCSARVDEDGDPMVRENKIVLYFHDDKRNRA